MRHKIYRISPLKCRDLAALLEFEIVWDYAVKAPAASLPSPLPVGTTGVSIAGLPPSSLLSTMKQQQQRHPHLQHHSGYPDTASSISSRRTTASMSSQSSDRDPLADLAGGSCAECRASKRRLERKEMQILQLESFLKESQKRIDSLSVENDELVVREQAETTNAGQYRAMTVRLLQELEMAFQFCATQALQAQQAHKTASDGPATTDAVAASFMFLPQFEFMERVKQFHDELNALAGMADDDCIDGSSRVRASPAGLTSAQDAWKLFDFRTEMDTALERNQRLQRQLEFLSRSLVYDVAGGDSTMKGGRATPPRLHRTDTTASADTSGGESDNSLDDSFARSHAAPVLTMTEQINSLERENFVLKAKLDRALEDAKHFSKAAPSALHSETGDTHSSSSRGSRRAHNDDIGDIDADDDPDVRALHVELERVQDANAELEQANAALAHDKSALERELTTLQTEVETLQRQVDEHTAKLASSSSSQDDASESASVTPAAPGFLNKIYQDVGKAKMALEEKVKQLNALLRDATDENLRLLAKVEAQQEQLDRVTATANAADRPSDGIKSADRAWVSALEEQVEALQATLNDSSNQLAAKDRELAALTQRIATADSAKSAAVAERDAAQRALTTAQDRVAALEQQLRTVAVDDSVKSLSVPSSPSSFVLNNSLSDRSDEVAELSKQLKLAKQEVMQLRYRSNQMESVHERLEDALKEKRTLEVKLTALEGQLYDHRSRTISDNSFATDQNAMVTELQKQLDQRAAQLQVTQRELEMLRRDVASRSHGAAAIPTTASASGDDAADVDALGRKVARFEAEIAALCERNDTQARKLDALESRIARVTHERTELEGICRDLVEEMDAFTALQRSGDANGAVDRMDEDEDDVKPPAAAFAPVPVAVPALVTTTPTKVTDRYASALAANDRSGAKPTTPVASGASAPQSKIAHLIKNFSSGDDDASGGRRPSDPHAPSVKRFAKVDFRGRNGSSASARSNSNGSAVEAMAARFRSGTGASVRA